ncbi:MAG: M1 family metallopeptidase [Acidobacteriia bacterium]|nr:M1 family metallopeptidase [Terriglobia bacterium]
MATFVKSIGRLLVFTAALAGAQRLPNNVVPDHYDLTFTPDLKQATFAGSEVVRVRLIQPGRSVVLNAAEIAFKEASITQDGRTQAAQVSLAPGKEQATLTVAEPLAAGPASIQIQFTGILNDKLRGFYLARTKLRNYATTQFESTDARRAFPSFDEPAMKATFDISLIVDKGDTAISNGRIISDTPGPGENKHTLKFSTTRKMSSYLVAMAVGDFQCNEGSEGGIPIRVCGTPDKKPLGTAALRYAGEILKYYNDYYGIPYPFEKLDIVGLPDFEAGAMENTGAIFYRETLLFIDEKNSAVDSRAAVFEVLAHEMAHQWFGDLVTMKWWDNVWLNEGFATWMESKPSQALHPEWHGTLSAVRATNTALTADALRSTHPIRARAETPEEINELFDSISYEKGAAVLRMIETYVSPEVFRRGVNAYLRKFAYGNATAEDFWETLTTASGRPVNRIMPTFVNQPGEPLIKVKSECIQPPPAPVVKSRRRRARRVITPQPKTEITIAQQRFLSTPAAAGGPADPLWMVPVCIKSETGKPFCQVFSERSQVVRVAGCSSWVFANSSAVGYYRTQYDAAALKSLGAVLMDQLSPAERMSMVQDQAALTRSGQETVGAFLDLVAALNQGQEYSIVDAYSGNLEQIRDYLLTSESRQAYQEWIRSNFRPMMTRVGWTPASGDTDDTRLLRAELVRIMGTIGEDPETISASMKMARQYLKDPNSVDASMAQEALTVAARNGDLALFEDYVSAMGGMSAPEQFYAVGSALAEFRDPKIVERVLKSSVSDEVRTQDAAGLIAAIVRAPENQAVAWAWVKDHWAEVEKKITMSSGGIIVNATSRFCDAAMRDDVKQFFTEHKVPSTERALKVAVERMNSCISFRERQKANLAAWLNQHGDGNSTANR